MHLSLMLLVTYMIIDISDASDTSDRSDEESSRVWNGTEFTYADYPFFTKLAPTLLFEGRVTCSGSLIARQWILTAAHCVYDGEKIKIFSEKFSGSAIDWYPYPGYLGDVTETLAEDIGLIKIPEQDGSLVTLSLPPPDQDDRFFDTHHNSTFIGAGAVNLGRYMTYRLKKTPYGSLTHHCNIKDITTNPHRGRMCWPIDSPASYLICLGDSGGPAFIENAQPLVASAVLSGINYDCNEETIKRVPSMGLTTFAGFTTVWPYVPWLLHQIDAESEKHGLESMMNLWSTDAAMSDFP